MHGNETREISFMKKSCIALLRIPFERGCVAPLSSEPSWDASASVLRLTVLHCVESPIRFFLRLPVLLYSDLRSHDALRFSSYSMLVCMTDLKLLRYLRLCSVLTWWPGTEPWREMALKGIYCLSAAAPSP